LGPFFGVRRLGAALSFNSASSVMGACLLR
jgi:hypothetical protein